MSEFKVGDKVRVLRVYGVSDRTAEVPYESVIVEHYEGSDRWYVPRRGGVPEKCWRVSEGDIELIEEPAPVQEAAPPSPALYEGWEDDVRLLASFGWGHGVGYNSAAERLLAALEPPKCGKVLCHLDGVSVKRWSRPDGDSALTCLLPALHDGPCIPDVPEEAWQ